MARNRRTTCRIGAKVGLFSFASAPAAEFGYADYDWFHVDPLTH